MTNSCMFYADSVGYGKEVGDNINESVANGASGSQSERNYRD